MVEIRKNGKRMEVPSSAYQNFYKGAGWFLVEEPSVKRHVEEKGSLDDVSGLITDDADEVDDSEWEEAEAEEEATVPEDVEKPIAQMNHGELIKKAESMGIDVSANPSSKQLREMIRRHA